MMTTKYKVIVALARIAGGIVFASSFIFLVGPELGKKATLGIILMFVGVILALSFREERKKL